MSLSVVKKRLISGICSILLFSSIWVMQAPAAYAQDQYLGEIRMFAGNFAPRGWALCDGQLLPISSNTALFSLIGTIYGGDGRTTFALPDLRGRVPVHAGTGAGLSTRILGEIGNTGGGQSDENMQPYGVVNFIIALQGIYPPRS